MKKILSDKEKTEKIKKYMVKTPEDYNFFRQVWQAIVVKFWYGMSFRFIYRIEIQGKENLPKNNDYIPVANHLSTLDPLVVTFVVKHPVAYMAKKELFYHPLLKIMLDWLGAFAVDRDNVGSSTIRTAKSIRNSKKWVLGLFPQGTREKSGTITKITKGFTGFAKSTKSNLLPIGIIGTDKPKFFPFTGGKIIVKVGKVIPYCNDTEKMYNEWVEAIQKLTGFKYIPQEA